MGVLRSDLIAHSQLTSANASVLFDGGDGNAGTTGLKTADSGNKYVVQGDKSELTIECWIYCTNITNTFDTIWATNNYGVSGNGASFYQHYDGVYFTISGGADLDIRGLFELNKWHHVATTRQWSPSKSTHQWRIYVDGEIVGYNETGNNISEGVLNIGCNNYGSAFPAFEFAGYISNFRMCKRVLYGEKFTPSKFKLKDVSGTVLLCCQDASDDTAVTVGDTLTAGGSPTPGGFGPDLKEDNTDTGPVFADGAVLDTLSYMVPPGGKTTDRYLKSTGDIVSGNLIWHIDAGNTTSYAGVTTSGTTIYDLKAGSGMNGTVGIATLTSGHSSFPAPGWTPDNGGAWYLASDTDNVPNNVGQEIIMPQYSLGNDNYTINVWIKLQYYSQQSDGFSYIISHNNGSPVSYHAHVKEVSGQGRIGAGAYYGGWNYDYASGASENTMIGLNKWYMLTWVNTAQYTQSMYVNGVIQKLTTSGNYTWNSRSSNGSPVNSTAYASNETTNAWIGQIQYYNDTLTEDEILQNYNAHKCRYDQ